MKAFLIAGEPSGDLLGGALLAGLQELAPGLQLAGVGGPAMAARGLDSLFPMSDLTLMGLAEVLPHLPKLFRRRDEAVRAIRAWRPDLLITIDSPDFTLRVTAAARAARPDLPTVHYVAPTVWAWRPGRATKMARTIDHVLALLPFEPPYMEAAGMSCDFVGHPVVEAPVPDRAAAAAFRAAHGIAADAPLVVVLPGSRGSEVKRLLPVFGAALPPIAAALPDLRVVVPAAGPVADAVTAAAAAWPGAPVLLDPRGRPDAAAEKRAAFAAADVAMAASGTVTLELAATATPHVIAYDAAWLTRQIAQRMLLTRRVNLVNLLTDSDSIPERTGAGCRADLIAADILTLLREPQARAAQTAAMAQSMTALGRGGPPPGRRAAQSVLRFLDRSGREAEAAHSR
ncbi:MAG: lipid-A-disaccharide synthase [Rhodobacteraceae bacterium]|jgi:lipid-A-disaccharide synthase|nr:lipid-A-disaccharide synthase [Paracoccaceae bacterium]